MQKPAGKNGEAYALSFDQEEINLERDAVPDENPDEFPIVGIGASAGGIGALGQFFKSVPKNPGMSFIVVLHMNRERRSILPDIIQRHTVLPTVEAEDGMTIQPDHVYIATPKENLYISDHSLRLAQKPERSNLDSIDVFFRSMAESLKDKSIGIILSGMGSDGTFGARLINQRLGLVVVQEPATAEYFEMPRSVIATGAADHVLPPEKMPEYLLNYSREFFGRRTQEQWGTLDEDSPAMKEIFSLVLQKTRVDLANYKLPTIRRHIQRIMALKRIGKIEDYLELLKSNADEVSCFIRFLRRFQVYHP